MPAIIFDFDGVIADSEPLHERALARLAHETLGYELTHADYMDRYVAFDDRDAIRQFHRDADQPLPSPERLAEQAAQKQVLFDELIASGGVQALPGAVELIDACVAADTPRAIASGATRQDITQILQGLGRRDAFEIIVSADDVERSKPHPATYRLACEHLHVDPAHALAIEDTAAGLASARDAGLLTVAVATTHCVSYLRPHAHHVVASLTEVTLDDLLKLLASRPAD